MAAKMPKRFNGNARYSTPPLRYPSLGESAQRQRVRRKVVRARVSLFLRIMFSSTKSWLGLCKKKTALFHSLKDMSFKDPKKGSFFATKTGDTARSLPVKDPVAFLQSLQHLHLMQR